MRIHQRLPGLVRRGRAAARRVARALGAGGRRLAERLAYRPPEIIVVALLAGGLVGGLAVERWRTRHPASAARLEAEPPRPVTTAGSPPPRARARRAAAPCEAGVGGSRVPWRRGAPGPPPRLDLNRATPREIARLAGISWGLAARIVAARDALEREAAGPPDTPPADARPASPAAAPVAPGADAADPPQ